MSSHDVIYALALLCFLFGALKKLSVAGPMIDKIDWLCAGFFFVVLGCGFFLRCTWLGN